MRVFLAILAGKLVRLFCRILHKGGTAKPGEIAIRICPNLLEILGRGVSCVVITGTNGKTTSCRMVEEGVRQAGLSYFANRSGANLTVGILTDFIMNSTLTGRCRKEHAILETDEYAAKVVCRQLQPKVILVTNLFVDQVDRFGGVRNTRDGIRTAIESAPGAVLVLNADCSVTASLARGVPNPVIFYGIDPSAMKGIAPGGSSDVEDCYFCGGKLEYDYRTFSHLGGFRCPDCRDRRPEPGFAVTAISRQDLSGSEFTIRCPEGETSLAVNLPALYNIYNAAGSYAALRQAGVAHEAARAALACFKCGFGRMEPLKLGQKGARMVLVKNCAGCDQVLHFLTGVPDAFDLCIYLNNRVSDGVDISWLEAARFEDLNQCCVRRIYVSGDRMKEVYARLRKAGIGEDRLIQEQNCARLIGRLKNNDLPLFLLPTYTGMMEARGEIVKQCGGSDFWEG